VVATTNESLLAHPAGRRDVGGIIISLSFRELNLPLRTKAWFKTVAAKKTALITP